MDEILLKFVGENWVSITLILAVLKVLAAATPWATDDKIISIFTKMVTKR